MMLLKKTWQLLIPALTCLGATASAQTQNVHHNSGIVIQKMGNNNTVTLNKKITINNTTNVIQVGATQIKISDSIKNELLHPSTPRIVVIPKIKDGVSIPKSLKNEDAHLIVSRVREFISESIETVDADAIIQEHKSQNALADIALAGATVYIEVAMERKNDGDTHGVQLSITVTELLTQKVKYNKSFFSGYFEEQNADILIIRALRDNADDLAAKIRSGS